MKEVNNAKVNSMKKKVNKYVYLYVVQGYYGYGWEDLCASENILEARSDYRDYRFNECGVPHRIIHRRELNPACTVQC